MAPATGAGIFLTDLAHLVGIGVPLHTTLSLTRCVGVLGACGFAMWLLLRSDRIGALRAMGLTMLVIVALGPVVQPWYLSWGLVVLAPVATGKVRTLIVGSSIAAAFIGLPAGQLLVSGLFSADPLTVAVALLVCLAILTVPLSPFDRERLLARWRRQRRRESGGPLRRGRPVGVASTYRAERADGHSIRCRTATSIQRPNFRPTSRSTPTGAKPQARCRAIEGSLSPEMRAMTVWKPRATASVTSSSRRSRPTPLPRHALST